MTSQRTDNGAATGATAAVATTTTATATDR